MGNDCAPGPSMDRRKTESALTSSRAALIVDWSVNVISTTRPENRARSTRQRRAASVVFGVQESDGIDAMRCEKAHEAEPRATAPRAIISSEQNFMRSTLLFK